MPYPTNEEGVRVGCPTERVIETTAVTKTGSTISLKVKVLQYYCKSVTREGRQYVETGLNCIGRLGDHDNYGCRRGTACRQPVQYGFAAW